MHTVRLSAAVSGRDLDALPDLIATDAEFIHHPTGGMWTGAQELADFRHMLATGRLVLQFDALATLGDAIALYRQTVGGQGGGVRDVGPFERDQLVVGEVDANGRACRVEFFAPHELADATARLYQRHASRLPDGPARERAIATARTVEALCGAFDADLSTVFAPDVECVDHRTTGFGSGGGVDWMRRCIATGYEVADDLADRFDDVVAAQPDALLVRWTTSGKERIGGGPFEWRHFRLFLFDSDGLVRRVEVFDVDRHIAALARYDALTMDAGQSTETRPPHATGAPGIANAATRAGERLRDTWNAHDWEGFAALFPKGFRAVDRPQSVALELDRERLLVGYRSVFEMPTSRQTSEPLATRGGRLALSRVHWEGTSDSVGPSEIDFLIVVEVDERGDLVAIVSFDLDELDAAHAELDRRYAAGEGRAHPRIAATASAFLRAFADRNWDELAACFASDLVVHDHRRLGWETLRGPAAYVHALTSLVDLAPDARLRLDHVELSDCGLLWVAAWHGTQGGGSFETPWIIVSEHDASGTVHRVDQYDLDQLDDARACFGELRRPDPLRIPPNAATRALDRWQNAIEARNLDAVQAWYAPVFVFDDRRRLVRVESDREMAIANIGTAISHAIGTGSFAPDRRKKYAVNSTSQAGHEA